MSLKGNIAVAVLILGCFTLGVLSMTNCHLHTQCNRCARGHYKLLQFNATTTIRVCCPGCSSRYMSITDWPAGPSCTCLFDFMKQDDTCWKGEQCCGCDSIKINGMPVCCSRCRGGSLTASAKSCRCALEP